MALVRSVLIATYGRAMKKLNVARKHLPHDKLVLVCDSGDKDIPVIRQNIEERGGEFAIVQVDPYDFEECLEACYRTIEEMRPRVVRVNVSCGPKTLVGAMMFAAFHAGVEVYHCDVEKASGRDLVIRLPTLLDFELRRRFTEDDWRIVRLLKKRRTRGYISRRSGIGNNLLDRALTRLQREGLLELDIEKGKTAVVPTAIGQFYAKVAPGQGARGR
jgi:hypothetical protein